MIKSEKERFKIYVKAGYGEKIESEDKKLLSRIFKLHEDVINEEITIKESEGEKILKIWYMIDNESRIICEDIFNKIFGEIDRFINLYIIALRFRSMKAYKKYLKRYHNDTI